MSSFPLPPPPERHTSVCMPKTPSPRPRPKSFRPPSAAKSAASAPTPVSSRARSVHPLRELRDALGEVRGERISQPAFAELLGVSASLINAIESNEARKVSEDLHQRILTRFGVRIEEAAPPRPPTPGARPARHTAASAPRVICLAFPKLPLVEGLRRHQAEHPQIEAGALRAFDRTTLRRLRTILLAAHKAGKAAIALDLLQTRAEQIRHDLALPAATVAAAQKEIEAHRNQFPPGLFTEESAADQAYIETLRVKGMDKLRRKVSEIARAAVK